MIRAARILIAILAARFSSRATRGQRLRVTLEQLGGAWAKLGQMLSTRYDLLPEDVCDALRSLQCRIPGQGGDYGRQSVTAALGSMAAFAEFQDEPIAAATISQVHRARLVSGDDVAVKVLRPGIRAQYAADFKLLGRVAWFINLFATRLSLPDLIAEMRAVVAEELDLRFEAEHMEQMRAVLRQHRIRVPATYPGLCTEQVMVCAWVDGTVMSDVLAMPDRDVWLRSRGLTGKRISRRLLNSLMRQVFETNRFHSDLHPGNLMIAGRRLIAIDFGATSATDRNFLDTFTSFIAALAVRDYAHAADLYCLLCIWPQMRDAPRAKAQANAVHAMLRRALVRIMTAWAARAEVPGLPFAEKSINRLSLLLMATIRRVGGSMQWAWFPLTRAFSHIEATLGELWPKCNYMKELRRYRKGALKRERLRPIHLAALGNILMRALDRIDEWGRLQTTSTRLDGIQEGW